MNTAKTLEGMADAAREAGEIMRSAAHIRETVTAKEGHANFVTTYDKRVQGLLFLRLGEVLGNARFIGEEDGADRLTEADRQGFAFCVDPIDGTSNFMTGFRPSVTSIALLRDGAPFLAVIYEPYRDLMFTAARGEGAFLNGSPLRASDQPLERSLVSFGTAPYYEGLQKATFSLCGEYLPRCIDLRRTGSAAWDICTVAMGAVGLFFELRLQLWDYAAAGLIAAEAGCTLTDIRGRALTFDGPSSVLCASPGVAGEDYLPGDKLLSLIP